MSQALERTPWKQALESTVIVILVQFFIYYFQFVASDCFPVREVVVKTFLFAPLLLYFVNLLAFLLLDQACCQTRKQQCAEKVVGFAGIIKALIILWSTCSVRLFQDPCISYMDKAKRFGTALASFLVALFAFFVVGFPTVLSGKEFKDD
jgi:hypothetical protein